MSQSPRNHAQQLMASLRDPNDAERLREALLAVRRSLLHTRTVANGLDFLLSGTGEEIRLALRTLKDLERRADCPLSIDYVQLGEYFLLRVVGSTECQDLIRSYLEEPDPGSRKAPRN
jgi:hypothetical protein